MNARDGQYLNTNVFKCVVKYIYVVKIYFQLNIKRYIKNFI